MKIGITFVAFKHLHAGYVQMLEEAKKQCDYLIVGLNTNIKEDMSIQADFHQSLTNRYIQLKGCKYVDEIIPYETETDLENILRTYHINIRIIGEEYKKRNFTAKDYCNETNISIYYNRRELQPYLAYSRK